MDEPLLSECFKLVSLLEKKVFRSLKESVLDNDLTNSLWCYVYLTKIIVSFDFSGVILMSFWQCEVCRLFMSRVLNFLEVC